MLSGCPEFHRLRLQRRHLLKIGAFGLAGAALPGVMQANQPRGRARSVIFLYQFGGPSHHDTFDLKPDAPDNIRGEFRPIATNVTGLRICEHLPQMARQMHRVTLVRSVNHRMRNHNSASYQALTGAAPPLDDIRLRDTLDLYPAYGSAVARLRPAEAGMPSFVAYPHVLRDGSITPGQHASFLGKN